LKNLIDKLKRYETERMSARESLEFFAELIREGSTVHQEVSEHLIAVGVIDSKGNITQMGKEAIAKYEEMKLAEAESGEEE
jgi:hypothetical protein